MNRTTFCTDILQGRARVFYVAMKPEIKNNFQIQLIPILIERPFFFF